MKISLCMIVKNEEDILNRCLDSTGNLFDEIIIVDTGSTDSTKEIAKQYTDSVYHFDWIHDFSAARNFAFSKASGDYIMWLDADDIIKESELEKFMQIKESLNGDVDCYMLKYAVDFDKDDNILMIYYRERIVKNDGTFVWNDPVHETMTPHGKIVYGDATVEHRKTRPTKAGRNLNIYENMIKDNKTLTPRQQFYYARELYYNSQFNKAIDEFVNFLSQKDGWIENKIEAHLNLSQCFSRLNDYDNALKYLFNSFLLSEPRAEILCEIGDIFIRKQNFSLAIYWFLLATKCKPNIKSGAFVLKDCYDLIPHLQLCFAYYKLNDFENSKKHHKLAKKINKNHASVLHNNKFFKELEKSKKEKLTT